MSSSSMEFHTSVSEIEREIKAKAKRDAELRVKGREGAEKVKDYAQHISPVGDVADGDDNPGSYAGAWHVADRVRKTADGMPVYRVVNDSPKAELIENGTGQKGPRKQGGSSPEFAIRAKTAAHFGGTEQTVDAPE